MDNDTQYFSIKKMNSFLWKTKLTKKDVLETLQLEQFKRDWLVCPHGEAEKAVDGEQFVANPDIFSATGYQQPSSDGTIEPNQATRVCLDCGAPLQEIRLIDRGHGDRHHPFQYTAIDASPSFVFGRYQPNGQIQAYLCQSCGAVRLYAKPND